MNSATPCRLRNTSDIPSKPPKMKTILLALCFISSVNAELIKSKEFLFGAIPPIKLDLNTGQHEQGKIASYQGYDKEQDIAYIIIVSENRGLAKIFEKKTDDFSKILEDSHNEYLDLIKVVKGTQKSSMKSILGENAIAFEFQCTGYAQGGSKSYHNGVRLFHENAFYTIQVASTKEATERAKPLAELLGTFVLLNETKIESPKAKAFIDGDKKTFTTLNHKKSNGLNIEFSYPTNWIAHEGEIPNVVQQFRSETGLEMAVISVTPFPLPEDTKFSEEDFKNFYSEENIKGMVLEGSKVFVAKQIKLEGMHAGLLEYSTTEERLGITVDARCIRYMVLYKMQFVTFDLFVTSPRDLNVNIADKMEEFRPLFTEMAATISLPNK